MDLLKLEPELLSLTAAKMHKYLIPNTFYTVQTSSPKFGLACRQH